MQQYAVREAFGDGFDQFYVPRGKNDLYCVHDDVIGKHHAHVVRPRRARYLDIDAKAHALGVATLKAIGADLHRHHQIANEYVVDFVILSRFGLTRRGSARDQIPDQRHPAGRQSVAAFTACAQGATKAQNVWRHHQQTRHVRRLQRAGEPCGQFQRATSPDKIGERANIHRVEQTALGLLRGVEHGAGEACFREAAQN